MENIKLQTKKLEIREGADPNYLACVVECPELKPHPNADRLEILTIFGNEVVVGKDSYRPKDRLIYFPVECSISPKFLSWANLFSKPEFNVDKTTKAYFGLNGRVRAIALRGVPSQGFLYKVSELAKYYEIQENTFNNGDIFDTVGDDVLVTKYTKKDSKSGEPNVKKSRVPKWMDKTIGFFPRPVRRGAYKFVNAWYNRNSEGIASRIVDGEFKFHYKTENLGKNIWVVDPDDYITISSKCHGTSAIYGNLQCKKPFNPFRSLANKFGFEIPDKEYKFIYSSRSVIKNRRDGKLTDDVWGIIASELEGKVEPNFTVYGEIVGYTPGGKMIQKDYDYGITPTKCEFLVYRVTYNLTNSVSELDFDEIEEFCEENGLKTVPVYYKGCASDLFNIPKDEKWHDNFLSALKEKYLDKTCELCTTGVVNEGVVLRRENNPKRTALKFKSPKFVIKESAARDNNEEDMEEDS